MTKSSQYVAMAAATGAVCLSTHSMGFAVPAAEQVTQPAVFGKAAAPSLSSGWETRAEVATEASGATAGTLKAFGLAAAIGMTMGAKSRVGRRAAQFKTPEEAYNTVIGGGEVRLAMTPREVLLSGIVTGFYIGFGGVLCSTVGGSALHLSPGLQRFLFGAVGFPLSIFLTTIAGGQGFTPNVSVMATAVQKKGLGEEEQGNKLSKMIQQLIIAYCGNAIGLMTVALMANWAALPCVPAAIEIAKHKVFDMSWMQVCVRGILGGWLIGLAVWTAQAAEDVASKFVTIWLCISTYVICQYEHCLANIFFVPCAIFAGAPITWDQFISLNLIPSTIGNFIGGFCMLAGSYRLVYGRKWKKEQEAKQLAPQA